MDTLAQQTTPQFQHLIGKQITVVHQNHKYIGTLEFAGINPIHDQFQVTIDRMPLWPVNPKTIKAV
jgi:hypothetical protein